MLHTCICLLLVLQQLCIFYVNMLLIIVFCTNKSVVFAVYKLLFHVDTLYIDVVFSIKDFVPCMTEYTRSLSDVSVCNCQLMPMLHYFSEST